MSKYVVVYHYVSEGYMVIDSEGEGNELGLANSFADSIRDKVAKCGHELCSDVEVYIRPEEDTKIVEELFNARKAGKIISTMETKEELGG